MASPRRLRIVPRLFVLLGCFFSLLAPRSHGQVDWVWRNPTVQGNPIKGACASGSRFVLVGAAGTILTSANAATWSVMSSPTTNDLNAVAFGNGVYVAVGRDGTIVRSSDAMTWAVENSGTTTSEFYSLIFANGLFVAGAGPKSGVSGSGEIYTSGDGVTWTRRVQATPHPVTGIAFGNGKFVAVGSYDGSFTSPDGLTWTQVAAPFNNFATALTFANGLFVAGSISGEIYTSPDGLTWTARTTDVYDRIFGICHTGSKYVAVTIYGAVLTSTNAITWSVAYVGVEAASVASGNGVTVIGGTNGSILTSPDAIRWTIRNGRPGINSLTYFNNRYIGAAGTFVYDSTDGQTWNFQRIPGNLTKVIVANGMLIGVGVYGTILTSPDGTNWTVRTSGTTQDFVDIEYGAGVFVAVTNANQVYTSPNAATWTARNTGQFGTKKSIAFGNGLFAIAGYVNSTPILMTSPDGTTWTSRSAGQAAGFNDIIFADNKFVALAGGKIVTSTDGVTWTLGASVSGGAIGYGNGRFVVGGFSGTLSSSTDAVTWTTTNIGSDDPIREVSYLGSKYYALGYGILTSIDGITWARQSLLPPDHWKVAAYGNGLFVAATQWSSVYDGGTILTSPDGITWTGRTNFSSQMNAISYLNGLFLAATDFGKILSSPDGITWTERHASSDRAYSFAWGNNTYVAAGGMFASTVLTSPDGLTWTLRTVPAGDKLYSVTYGNNTFVAVGGFNNATIMTSPDGITWTTRSSPATGLYRSVIFANGLFVAAGRQGYIATSPNGINWTTRKAAISSNTDYTLVDLEFRDGTFFALEGRTGILWSSLDAITWTPQPSSSSYSIAALAYGNGTFLKLGMNATILVAADAPEPANLTATPKAGSRIDLSWSDVAGETSYTIDRRTGPAGAWTVLAPSLPAGTTTYSDPIGQQAANYSYRIRSLFGTIGSRYSATASASTFSAHEEWRFTNFGTSANAGSAADNADPDSDGSRNIVELALGTDPNNGAAIAHPTTWLDDSNRLGIQFFRDAQLTNITYRVQTSSDLLNWTTIAQSVGGASPSNLGADAVVEDYFGGTRFRVTVICPPAEDGRQFVRVKVD